MNMEPKKTSRKSIKTVEISVAPMTAADKPSADSKPVKRTAAAKSKTTAKSASPTTSAPKNTSHRHSKVSPSSAPSINYEEVARLAYKYWEERSYAHGFAEEDWHRAESVISARS